MDTESRRESPQSAQAAQLFEDEVSSIAREAAERLREPIERAARCAHPLRGSTPRGTLSPEVTSTKSRSPETP
jgi:hypothetical protein